MEKPNGIMVPIFPVPTMPIRVIWLISGVGDGVYGSE